MSTRKALTSAVVCLVVCGSVTWSCDNSRPTAQLVLTQERVVRLPGGFDPIGVAGDCCGGFIVWDGTEPRVGLLDSAGIRVVEMPDRLPLQRVWWNRSRHAWDALTKMPVQVIRLTADLRFEDESRLKQWSGSEHIIDAVGDGDTLWVAYRAPGDRLAVDQILESSPSSRQQVLSVSFPADQLPDTAARMLGHLTRIGLATTLNLLWRPFDAYTSSAANGGMVHTRVLDQVRSYSDLPRRLRRSLTLDAWAALPAVALDTGWVVTIADLRSDERLLARFTGAGKLARLIMLNAPIGIVASSIPSKRLVAVGRSVDDARLYLYSWRWAPPEVR